MRDFHELKVVHSDREEDFTEKVNALLKEGFTVSSTGCGFQAAMDKYEASGWEFVALLLKPVPLVVNLQDFEKEIGQC